MTEHEAFGHIEKLIHELQDTVAVPVTRASRFREDLDMDSLAIVELVTAAEQSLGITVDYEDLDHFAVVDDLTRFVVEAKAS